MLGKKFRLTENYQYQFVYKKGDTVPSDLFLLVAAKSRFGGGYRVGFSVSNKIGKAVVRNVVKRRLRHAARELSALFLNGRYYVFSARVKSAEAPYPVLLKEMQRCLRTYAARVGAKQAAGESGAKK